MKEITVIDGVARTNAEAFRGFDKGTLLLSQWAYCPGSAELVFQHRNAGFELIAETASFPLYGQKSFKYVIRNLHRRGHRNVKIRIERESKARTDVWVNNKGQVVS